MTVLLAVSACEKGSAADENQDTAQPVERPTELVTEVYRAYPYGKNACVDSYLTIEFGTVPETGTSGQIRIIRADGTVADMIDMASKGLRVMNICVAIVGFNIVAGNLFQCLGMVRTAIVLSLSRQLLCLLPFLYLLPMWFGIKGVWISFPVADLVSTVVAVIFVVRLMRKFDRLKDGEDSSILGSAIK